MALFSKTFVLLCALCGVSSALACTIPVFRFALDRWEADPFRLVIPSSWVTQPDMIKLLVPLRGNAEANLKIEETSDASVSEAKLLFPHHDVPLWSGKLDAATLAPLLDSPARQELLKRILDGDSVVWVVCTKDADKAEVDRIEKRLRYLEQVAALPVQDPNDPDSQLGPGPPLKLKFSVLRISLDDPSEKLFAAMIAGPKQQDFIANNTSFAGPVFAKGRVLGAWPMSDLDDTAIEDTSLFLIGRCSCRIKNENPGWDVVLKADWERVLAKADAAKKQASTAAPEAAPAPLNALRETPQALAISLDGQVRTAALPDAGSSAPTATAPTTTTSTTTSSGTAVRTVTTVAQVPIAAIAIAALSVVALAFSLVVWMRR